MKMHYLLYLRYFFLLSIFLPCTLCADRRDELVFQAGWSSAHQGKRQHVDIEDLIGDEFSVRHSTSQNFVAGLGYYVEFYRASEVDILFGINGFYFAPNDVRGRVKQEDLFTNLSYSYSLSHFPIYFSTKALVHCFSCYDLTIDLGIGPNIIRSGSFKEHSLDDGVTIPDRHIFEGRYVVSFSAAAGLGWRINDFLKGYPLEVNYRFFYLGEGWLKRGNHLIKNNLHTGHCYANALFLSLSL